MAKSSKAAKTNNNHVRLLNRVFIRVILTALATIVAASPNSSNVANAINYDEKTGMPTSLSGEEFVIVRDVVLSDPKVQELIDDRNYVITDCCGFYQSGPSAPWQPVLNLRVANELQIGVVVDLDIRKVVKIESGPAVQHMVPKDNTTAAAEEIAESYSNDNTSIPMLATNNSTVLPHILVVGIVLGGAAVAVFYFLRRTNRLMAEEKK